MNLKDVSISIYSFGYSAGFIQDDRKEATTPSISIDNIAGTALQYGLGGIEFPVDRYFPREKVKEAGTFISELKKQGLRSAIDLETFDPEYILSLLPILQSSGLKFARIKMSGFYGGNRYQHPEFKEWVETFINQLRSLLPELRSSGIMLLIENHQDLGADDLIQVIGATSADCIGITWDMGNSLPVPDTPETFLAKSLGFIGNVHLKDYCIFRSENGYYLSRCALGDGVVDFGPLLKQLIRCRGPVPMAIELGAHNVRHADIYKPQYWEAYKPTVVSEKIDFFSFLNRHSKDGDGWMSPWEKKFSGAEIVAAEMDELKRSISFLEQLEV